MAREPSQVRSTVDRRPYTTIYHTLDVRHCVQGDGRVSARRVWVPVFGSLNCIFYRSERILSYRMPTLNDELDGEGGFSELVLQRHGVVSGVLPGHLAHRQRRHAGHRVLVEPPRVRQRSALVLPVDARLWTGGERDLDDGRRARLQHQLVTVVVLAQRRRHCTTHTHTAHYYQLEPFVDL